MSDKLETFYKWAKDNSVFDYELLTETESELAKDSFFAGYAQALKDNTVAIKVWERIKDKITLSTGCFGCCFGIFADCPIGGDITPYWNHRGERPDACKQFFKEAVNTWRNTYQSGCSNIEDFIIDKLGLE